VLSLSLELEQAFSLSRVVQEHIFEIPESAAPADGAFQALLQTLVVNGGNEGLHVAVTLMRTFRWNGDETVTKANLDSISVMQ